MSITKRLLLLILISVISLAVVGGSALWELRRTEAGMIYETENITPSISLLDNATEHFLLMRTQILYHILATNDEDIQRADREISQLRTTLADELKRYEALLTDNRDRALWEADREALNTYLTKIDVALGLSRQNLNTEARDAAAAARGAARLTQEALNAHTDYNVKIAEDFRRTSLASFHNAILTQTGIIILSILTAATLGFFTARHVRSSLNQIQQVMSGIAHSLDFTQRARADGQDEIAVTARALNELLERMQHSLRTISGQVEQVSAAAGRLADTSNEVSTASGEQSEASASMAAAIEEMTVSVDHVATRAGETNTLATHAGDVAANGAAVIGKTLEDIRRIEAAVRSAADMIQKLNDDSARVTSVVAVIKEVADQTNLLALNAAIEAARAGEQGRGFAVVADEVRKLAERTALSTQEISSTIGSMQQGARSAVNGMSQAVERVVSGVENARQAEESVREIEHGAQQTVEMVGEISSAIREQSSASASIAQQVERIAVMTDENSAAARSAADTASQLDALARAIQQEVQRYRV